MPHNASNKQIQYTIMVNLSVTHFVHISFTARNNKVITPIPTPQNICCTEGFATISLKIDANRTIARNAGVIIPIIAAIAPL